MAGEASGLSRRPDPIALAGRCGRLIGDWLPQTGMRPGEMVIRSPPFELERQFAERVGGAPRTTRETGDGAAHGQVESFDEGGLDAAGEAEYAQG